MKPTLTRAQRKRLARLVHQGEIAVHGSRKERRLHETLVVAGYATVVWMVEYDCMWPLYTVTNSGITESQALRLTTVSVVG